ncbi:MAG: hypothetical protein ABIG92_07665 [Candidatus Omnitrophota bacterium]
MAIRNNKGIALFITMGFSLLLIMLVAAILLKSVNYAKISETNLKRMRAFALTEAGVAYAYWSLAQGDSWSPSPKTTVIYPESTEGPLVIGGKPVSITVTDLGDGTYKIDSRATY